MTDISRYLDFVLKMFFAFGVAFEVPIATILVIWTGLVSAESLATKRPYIIVIAFVVGMLLTPPDVISQTLLALPMWLLFELGLVLSRLYAKKAGEADAQDNAVSPQDQLNTPIDTDSETDQETGLQFEDEDYQAPTEEQMDAELDRIEQEEEFDDNVGSGPHEEYEPIPEENTPPDPGSPSPDSTNAGSTSNKPTKEPKDQ